ncbi:hypothetical protein ACP70R_031957 [Stipagrostis hirtigluma subsp. patula]
MDEAALDNPDPGPFLLDQAMVSGEGAEELGIIEPDGGDAVVLVLGVGNGEGKHEKGPGALGGRRAWA